VLEFFESREASSSLFLFDPLAGYEKCAEASHVEPYGLSVLVHTISPVAGKDVFFTDEISETSKLEFDRLFAVGDVDVCSPVI